MELVKWLMLSSTNCTIDDTLTSSAASSGNLELVKARLVRNWIFVFLPLVLIFSLQFQRA